MTEHRHESHPAIVKRLNRAGGHLRSIVEMIEAGRSCVDVAQQLHAVEKAVASAKRALINDHIDHCLAHAEASDGVGSAVEEFRTISKYL
ncbi:MAG: metal-sensing transcriptional repressor [Pseudomonadota bacterium]